MIAPDTLATHPAERFRQLQAQLRQQALVPETNPWQSVTLPDDSDFDSNFDILVVPSLSLDQRELLKIEGVLHYEERLLFSLIRLRNPRTRLVYVTSQPLPPIVIDYYLQLLPGIPFSHARDRLLLLSTYDSSPQPLSKKILERPRLVERIRQALRPDRAYMTCFNASVYERDLSVCLGIPLLGCDPDVLQWGTKAGSRRIFAECGIAFPDGSDLVHNEADLATVAAELWERHPDLQRMVIKLNEGFSGEGNAILDLRPLQTMSPGQATHADRIQALRKALPQLRFQAAGETWESYRSRIPELGAIAEVFIEGAIKRSPSAQGYVTPTGEVEILSTHDQILGGPDGQIYLGCSFPAHKIYRLQLQDACWRIGRCLAAKGALERYGVDFVTVQTAADTWQIQAIEINLRKGGTTHPFMTLKYLTGGRYDSATGLFYSQQGDPKYYVATDNLQKPCYRGLLPTDLMDIIAYHRLHFDSSTKTGSVFHLMGCLSEYGKVGLISIGNSRQQAEDIYNQVVHVLDVETQPMNAHLSQGIPPMLWSGRA
ncbi:peptide ligase PGM1-related protein [Trichothermofontia sp.]